MQWWATPQTSRSFISQLPLAFDAGDGNFYRYAGNDSTNEMDPGGLQVDPLNQERFEIPGDRSSPKEKTDVVFGKVKGVLFAQTGVTLLHVTEQVKEPKGDKVVPLAKPRFVQSHPHPDGVFIVYTGDRWEDVRFIQFVSVSINETLEFWDEKRLCTDPALTRQLEIELPMKVDGKYAPKKSEGLVPLTTIGGLATGAQSAIDSVNSKTEQVDPDKQSPYYWSPMAGGFGGTGKQPLVSNGHESCSWIWDKPNVETVVARWIRDQRKDLTYPTRQEGHGLRITTRLNYC
jgi:hypothetical protein